VEGYYDLETHERNQQNVAIHEHSDAVALWYRALTLYRRAILGEWTLTGGEPGSRELAAEGLQMQLLGLAVSSMKAGLDMILAGYYSMAFCVIRHMLETFVQCLYAGLEPDEARHWYEQPGGIDAQTDPPAMLLMCQRIQANPEIKGSELDGLIDSVYAKWRLMSKGCHPSGAGIRQTASESETRHNVGATYHRDLCLAAFDVGLSPVSNLLPAALMRLRPEARGQIEEWNALRAEVSAWRTAHAEELRAAEGDAPASQPEVPAPRHDEVKRCWRLIRAHEEAMNRMQRPIPAV